MEFNFNFNTIGKSIASRVKTCSSKIQHCLNNQPRKFKVKYYSLAKKLLISSLRRQRVENKGKGKLWIQIVLRACLLIRLSSLWLLEIEKDFRDCIHNIFLAPFLPILTFLHFVVAQLFAPLLTKWPFS